MEEQNKENLNQNDGADLNLSVELFRKTSILKLLNLLHSYNIEHESADEIAIILSRLQVQLDFQMKPQMKKQIEALEEKRSQPMRIYMLHKDSFSRFDSAIRERKHAEASYFNEKIEILLREEANRQLDNIQKELQ